MQCGLIFIIFLIFVMAVAGVLIGLSIEESINSNGKDGVTWTQIIFGIILALGTFGMATRYGQSCN